MLTVLSVIGTRPEAIKMAPVIIELEQHPKQVRSVVCVTGQHRTMLDQALQDFNVRADYDLGVMVPAQTLSQLTARLFVSLEEVFHLVKPDWVLAQGDTTSALVASMVSFYHQIPFGHVEAGLRTNDRYRPFPEEVNRRLIDSMATLLFAPTRRACLCLSREGCCEENIILAGNTVVDALQLISSQDYDFANGPLKNIPRDRRLVLVTMHRRESFGEPLRAMCKALLQIASDLESEGVHLVCPVHPNPEVRCTVREILGKSGNISLLEPLDYRSLIWLMQHSELIMTDSGGIQEEAPSFKVPVLVMRDETERMEGIDSGVARLTGICSKEIARQAIDLLRNPVERERMTANCSPYGDGKAAQRIVTALLSRTPDE